MECEDNKFSTFSKWMAKKPCRKGDNNGFWAQKNLSV